MLGQQLGQRWLQKQQEQHSGHLTPDKDVCEGTQCTGRGRSRVWGLVWEQREGQSRGRARSWLGSRRRQLGSRRRRRLQLGKAKDLSEHPEAFIGGEESEVKKEISKAQDRVIMETLRGDEPPGTSALGLIACQFQQPAGQQLQDGSQQDGHRFAQL
ncbi:hypothetical protein A6R68_24056 [Neotoma lepida]|uniref:Uncharacterized protein n=1 Tax=Neotoma lepida TaxID=56216 RepID=A0A1A6HUP2_NEOLE|nr:hypothetical protein A6R68_24056 [Neotoma lepida]